MQNRSPENVTFLGSDDVESVLGSINAVELAEETLISHLHGQCDLPAESYLGWRNSGGYSARSLAMHGRINTPGKRAGVKIINGCLGNGSLGIQRAAGFLILFDFETSHPVAILDAADISARRTAAVSMAALRVSNVTRDSSLAFIGCGRQAREHLRLLLSEGFHPREIRCYDQNGLPAETFARMVRESTNLSQAAVSSCVSPRSAIEGSDIVVTSTTVDAPYIPLSWISPDSTILHVSLDDLLPEVFENAADLIVDDWSLIIEDDHRILGKMCRDGKIVSNSSAAKVGPGQNGDLASYILGHRKVQKSGITVINPFGMALQDIALGSAVFERCRLLGLGTLLPK